jgi:hypothetical protein
MKSRKCVVSLVLLHCEPSETSFDLPDYSGISDQRDSSYDNNPQQCRTKDSRTKIRLHVMVHRKLSLLISTPAAPGTAR